MSCERIALVLLVMAGCSVREPSPAVIAAPSSLRKLADVELTTQDQRTVRFYDDLVRGKVVLINFMFTQCEGLCPGTTAKLLQVQRQLGDRAGRDVFLLSIT